MDDNKNPRLDGLGIFIVVAALVYGIGFATWVFGETIRNNYGGDLRDEFLRANIAHASGQTAVIDGDCASACLVNLPRACLTPRARLGFHSPSGGTKADREKARLILAQQMPPAMAKWYLSGPAYSNEAVWLNARQAVEMGARRC